MTPSGLTKSRATMREVEGICVLHEAQAGPVGSKDERRGFLQVDADGWARM